MNKIKLLLIDMDQTCHHPFGEIVEHNIEPLKKIIELGIKVVFATGRPYFAKPNGFKKNLFLKKNVYVAGFNGAIIKDLSNNETLALNTINENIVKKVFDYVKETDINCLSFGAVNEQNYYVNAKKNCDTKFIDRELVFLRDNCKIIQIKNVIDYEPVYKFLVKNSNSEINDFFKSIGLNVMWEPKKTAEINLAKINKGYVVDFFKNKFNLKDDEIIAIGDGPNDLEMLKKVKYSFCPSNATKNIKDHCYKVVNLKYDEGVVKYVIENYILNNFD